MSTYLTPEQVHELNEKHGWFEFQDAQSDVSRAFAQDAIAKHEAMRNAAPDMLAALVALAAAFKAHLPEFADPEYYDEYTQALDAIAKAKGIK